MESIFTGPFIFSAIFFLVLIGIGIVIFSRFK
jgi:hypothetical protein